MRCLGDFLGNSEPPGDPEWDFERGITTLIKNGREGRITTRTWPVGGHDVCDCLSLLLRGSRFKRRRLFSGVQHFSLKSLFCFQDYLIPVSERMVSSSGHNISARISFLKNLFVGIVSFFV